MMIAADFGIPPWQLDDAPAEWIDRWLADNQAAMEAEPTTIASPSVGTGKRVTRVI